MRARLVAGAVSVVALLAPAPASSDYVARIVTFTVGGNDIGFTSIAENCLSAVPTGTFCKGYCRRHRPKVAAVIRWVEPLAPANAAAPIHPDLLGMTGASRLVVAAAR